MNIKTPSRIEFFTEKRINPDNRSGFEWTLVVKIDKGNKWVLKTYEKEPKNPQITEDQNLVIRSFSVYHSHIALPRFGDTVILKV